MTRSLALGLALALIPLAGLAQEAPPPPPPDAAGLVAPDSAMKAAMQQFRAQREQYRVQTRSNMLAAMTPQHRAAVATIVGQLALTPNPNPRLAAQQLDALLSPNEKQSVVNIAQTARANGRALMEQERAAIASTLTADERAKMQARESKMQAFMQSHPRPARAVDPGEIVLHTLGSFGGPEMGGMRPHAF